MRISLELSSVFEDHRRSAVLLVNDSMRFIKDVEDRIKTIFGIDNFCLLLDKNYYLPSAESVEILTSRDVIWVVPITEENRSVRPKRKRTHQVDEIAVDKTKKRKKKQREVRDSSGEERKSSHKDSGIETPNDEGRNSVKKLANMFESGRFKELEKKSINIVETLIVGKDVGVVPSSCPDPVQQDSSSCENENPEPVIQVKRKRKRTRKRKTHETINVVETKSVETQSSRKPLAIPRPVQHIHFDGSPEAGSNSETPDEPAPEDQQEDLVDTEFQLSEDFISKQPLMDTNSTPQLDQRIAFKVLKISTDYTPELSGNIVGKVVSFDEQTGDIEFLITYGKEQLAEPKGKFSLDMGETEEIDSEPIDEDDVRQSFVWTQILEKRLILSQ